ncbi:putative Zinc finger protein [Quillaja saponaria]|uniref:Zinc finger protein n=1 Tax=Quillaja saponaria TaxID=32244 RepID=A0AAD7VG17_QUISA|nr:putative Zinc finger protein [Quillaja saponaria]
MEKDQEASHACKFCGKRFLSGKVLGGHMRCHTAQNSAKTGFKASMSKSSKIGFEGDPDTGYGLRENPRKSCKLSGSGDGISGQESVCKVCGKGFESMRALFGHMRHHSGKQKKGIFCKECGKGFQSLRALTGHMKTHSEGIKVSKESATSSSQKLMMDSLSDSETQGLVVRRKRSRRTRYKIAPNSSFSNLNESSYVTESEQEVEQGALCLMMLSRGVRHWENLNSVTETSENNSVPVEVKSSYQISTGIVETNEAGNFIWDNGDDDDSFKMKKPRSEKLDSCVADSRNIFGGKEISEFDNCEHGCASDNEEKVGFEVPTDIFYGDADYKMPGLHDESEVLLDSTDSKNEDQVDTEVQITEVEIGEDFLEEAGLDTLKYILRKKAWSDACDVQLKENFGNIMYTPGSENKGRYKYKTDHKILSHQDLKGHQIVHKTNFSEWITEDYETDNHIEIVANCKLNKPETHVSFLKQGMNGGTEASYELRVSKEHKCPTCLKVFTSGQALGGHKRAHIMKNSQTKAEQPILMKQEISDGTTEFDLNNIPVMLKESADVDTRFSSCMLANDHNHELLVV